MANPRWINPYFKVLYADEISGIGTAVQVLDMPAGSEGRYVEVINTGSSKIYFTADSDPSVGNQGVLPPGVMYYGEYDAFTSIHYKSSASGGVMSIIIRGT